MATPNYRVLGQANPPAGVLTDIYVVGPGSVAVISSILIAEQGGTATTFRASIAINGAADARQQYFAYNAQIDPNDGVDFTAGMTLDSGDTIRGYGAVETLSWQVFGEEILKA